MGWKLFVSFSKNLRERRWEPLQFGNSVIFGSTTLLQWLWTFLPGLWSPCSEKNERDPNWGENYSSFEST